MHVVKVNKLVTFNHKVSLYSRESICTFAVYPDQIYFTLKKEVFVDVFVAR